MFNNDPRPDWASFTALVVSPVRNTRDEGDDETCIEICVVTALEGWTIYGQHHSGEDIAIHDALSVTGFIRPLLAAVAASSLPIVYRDEDNRTPPSSLSELCDRLAEIIHADLNTDAHDDLEAHDDDFDAHPLCALREAIGEKCGHFGIEECPPDPYDALRLCVHNLEQMQGMFPDTDGSIQAAIDAGNEALDAMPMT